ncbi:chemotaxis protein [uncultured Clostridium sp.]|jgi:two-component system chemotaxis response regulator CheV|uniref:chemotaxis protein n=1 Tax=uncultured Clostridium sp. TaxID=59620 RepID=UPI0026281AF8|nr:chemotaxis protein [uncultured Clostridium sp.]
MSFNSDILLESGTGELEVLKFRIGKKLYAINIIKVKEVVDCNNLTTIPDSHDEIAGVILCRDEIIPLVDLIYILDKKKKEEEIFKTIICEFNEMKVAFNIDEVIGVQRIRWSDIIKPMALVESSLVIGNIIEGEKVILLLDFEKIVTDINPKVGISEDRIVDVEYRERDHIKIGIVDDSLLIRNLLGSTLEKAGFKDVRKFEDGECAYEYLEKIVTNKKDRFVEDIQLLITDIEMPRMDGHTLTKKIKEHDNLKRLPVIIFSSLITRDLEHKGLAVGADAQFSKPEVEKLIEWIDNLYV